MDLGKLLDEAISPEPRIGCYLYCLLCLYHLYYLFSTAGRRGALAPDITSGRAWPSIQRAACARAGAGWKEVSVTGLPPSGRLSAHAAGRALPGEESRSCRAGPMVSGGRRMPWGAGSGPTRAPWIAARAKGREHWGRGTGTCLHCLCYLRWLLRVLPGTASPGAAPGTG